MEIPTYIVGKYEMMDPKTEYLVPDGYNLRNGMVVLVAAVDQRYDELEGTNPRDLYLLKVENRWARISNVTTKQGTHGASVIFVATYGDETQVLRNYTVTIPWLVKKDSVSGLSRQAKELATSPDWVTDIQEKWKGSATSKETKVLEGSHDSIQTQKPDDAEGTENRSEQEPAEDNSNRSEQETTEDPVVDQTDKFRN